jgi:uncharacterized glyoxalase superfamily protein PhnB
MSVDPFNKANFSTLTPMLFAKDVKALAEFYRDSFGFDLLVEMIDAEGNGFAEVKTGESKFMIIEEEEIKQTTAPSTLGGVSVCYYVYVLDVDKYLVELKSKKVTIAQECIDMPWGDRCAVAIDPEGHSWMFATHKIDMDM